MTDIEINTAISAACGWKPCEQCLRNGYKDQWRPPSGDGCEHVSELPNYCHNLNMIWSAEETLTEPQQDAFLDHLWDAIWLPVVAEYNPSNPTRAGKLWMMVHSTARQRAEAFLRTIGKWRDE